MVSFRQEVEEILRQNEVKAKKSQAVLQQVMLEKGDLQQDMSTDRDAITVLERDLRETRSALDAEVELRRQVEAERDSNREDFLNFHAGKISQLERDLADAQARAAINNRLPTEDCHQRESVPPAYEEDLQMETESNPTHQDSDSNFGYTSHAIQLEQAEPLRTNLAETARKLTSAEQALQVKDGELRSLRDKIARIREMRETEREAKKVAEADVVKLMETLKQQRLKTSDWKKQYDQTAIKLKAETAKHQGALEEHRQVASEFDNVVRQHDSLMEEKRILEKAMQEGEPTQITLLAAENVKLKEKVKNLTASVMTAGADTRRELEKEASTQRDCFLVKINACGQDNAKLRRDLSHANATVQALTAQLATTSSQLQSAMRSRDESPQQYSDGAQYSDEDEEEDGHDDEDEDNQACVNVVTQGR
ncbi:hypothetical protein C8R47DRAFT_6018 [Mycena vitilis]|nr:hypothetical protein C8R47DRAFT_6018 [Mycena vitilis]